MRPLTPEEVDKIRRRREVRWFWPSLIFIGIGGLMFDPFHGFEKLVPLPRWVFIAFLAGLLAYHLFEMIQYYINLREDLTAGFVHVQEGTVEKVSATKGTYTVEVDGRTFRFRQGEVPPPKEGSTIEVEFLPRSALMASLREKGSLGAGVRSAG